MLFSKLENQFLCLLIASFALIFRSGLSGGCLLGLTELPLSPFLRCSAVLETELDRLSLSAGLLERDLTWTLCLEEDSPDSESDLEPGRCDTELVREPVGLVTWLLWLRLSSRRLSPEPILSNRARAVENRSW